MPEYKIDELLLEWADEAGRDKGIKFEHGCAPPGPAVQHDAGDRWGIESFNPENVTICRWIRLVAASKDVPSPFPLPYDDFRLFEEKKAAFIKNVSSAIDYLRDR